MDAPTTSDVTRRTMIRGVAVGAVAVPALAACGDDTPDAPRGGSTPTGSTPAPSRTNKGGGGAAEVLAEATDVEVGGALFLEPDEVVGDPVNSGIVITQPSEGEFKAFGRECTHMQCAVSDLQDGRIHCFCHGSLYDAESGTNVGGPAPRPLTEVPITVKNGKILRA